MFDISKEYAQLAEGARLDWSPLEGSSVLVTGATGLIGSLCVRLLLELNRQRGTGISVHALVRDEARARHVLSDYGPDDGLSIMTHDVCEESVGETPCDYLIHAACPTASAFFASHPVETTDAIVLGTRNMLAHALKTSATSMVYISSMEVYGNGNPTAGLEHLLTEADTGYVDPAQVRSCYPEGKRMAENYCTGFAAEYGVPVRVARLAQTFGPGIPKNDGRLFAQIAHVAMDGGELVLKTTGESTRMYVYTTDAIMGILTILLHGEPGGIYNVANPRTYSSVKDMAEKVIDRFSDGRGHVVVDVDPRAPYPPNHHLPLDVSRLTALGWEPMTDLETMYQNLIDYLRD